MRMCVCVGGLFISVGVVLCVYVFVSRFNTFFSVVTVQSNREGEVCMCVCVCEEAGHLLCCEASEPETVARGLKGERDWLFLIALLWVYSLTPCFYLVPYVCKCTCVFVSVFITSVTIHTIHSRFTPNGRETQAFQRKCLFVSKREASQRYLPQPPGPCTGRHAHTQAHTMKIVKTNKMHC